MSMAQKNLGKPVRIVEVYADNCLSEFQRISAVLPKYRMVAMDTEFPGVIYKAADYKNQTQFEYYDIMRKNVHALKPIQVGLTLADSQGNLPDFGTHTCIWQFNLSDFDIAKDLYAADSVALLRKQGIDFEKNRREGIDSKVFAALLLQSGMFSNYSVTWITFHGSYDFAYLLKLLIHPAPLPTRLEEFMRLVNHYFGTRVYDIKHMMKSCQGLFGGLERVSKALGVKREVGDCHQAGSDSLLTMKTFVRMYAEHFRNQNIHGAYGGMLHDLSTNKVDVPTRSSYEAVVLIRRNHRVNVFPYNCQPIRRNYAVNGFPYNCQPYRNGFPVYSNLINPVYL
ncbi:hypothetical protein MKW94_014387 [Papaver nudicaule]|uniref:poly(A)-specific ribonuclease n=1 Tax=Papaver nudicaule TaxID=74823 RepID=A0AA41RSP3_PAPNU|nr:hypothetical protein [Papaver nudicaule]